MINAIVLTAIILIVIYIFLFRRIKKNREKTFDTVQEYHDNYIDKKSFERSKNQIRKYNNKGFTYYSSNNPDQDNDYVTRFNSEEDYREL